MALHHDPFRCPHCQSTRTRSMRMVAMTGTRAGRARLSRATIGARGWWSFSGTNARWVSQSALAKRYAPTAGLSAGVFTALIIIGVLINGARGASIALALGLAVHALLVKDPPNGFVCLRCGSEFSPGERGTPRDASRVPR